MTAAQRKLSLVEEVRIAWADPEIMAKAGEAVDLVTDWLGSLSRMPGADTATRCAHRIYHGMTASEAAIAEYLYRWHLPLNQWINHTEAKARSRPVTGAWPVPHLIGL